MRLHVMFLSVVTLIACDGQLTNEEGETRTQNILGGTNTDISVHPWQVSLQTDSWGHFCGAVVLSSEWLVTAQHCSFSADSPDARVVAGATRLSSGARSQVRRITDVIRHPNYDDDGRENDIALLKLDSPLDLRTQMVKPAKMMTAELAQQGLTAPGVEATVSGWGVLVNDENADSSNVLQELRHSIISNEEANLFFQEFGLQVSETQLPVNGGPNSACYGDSGGPLTVKDVSGTVYLAGLASWLIDCGSGPSVYTRMSAYESWVRSQISLESREPTDSDSRRPIDGRDICTLPNCP